MSQLAHATITLGIQIFRRLVQKTVIVRELTHGVKGEAFRFTLSGSRDLIECLLLRKQIGLNVIAKQDLVGICKIKSRNSRNDGRKNETFLIENDMNVTLKNRESEKKFMEIKNIKRKELSIPGNKSVHITRISAIIKFI